MSTFAVVVSAVIGLLILGYGFKSRRDGTWSAKLFGRLILFYGFYFSLFIGSYSSLVLPGIGSISIGVVAGGAVGLVASAIIGTIGVATGGVGIAIGALGMALIGATLGAIGAGSGGIGIKTTTYFLVTPWFWIPLILTGLFLAFRGGKAKVTRIETKK